MVQNYGISNRVQHFSEDDKRILVQTLDWQPPLLFIFSEPTLLKREREKVTRGASANLTQLYTATLAKCQTILNIVGAGFPKNLVFMAV